MVLYAQIQSIEDGSYEKQNKEKVHQWRLILIDRDKSRHRLKSTVEITIPGEDRDLLGAQPVDVTTEFYVTEIRPPMVGTAMRLTGRVNPGYKAEGLVKAEAPK